MVLTESLPEYQAFAREQGGEAVASVGDGELRLLRRLVDTPTLDALLSAARTSMNFDTELDTVDGEATFLATIVEDGETVDETLAALLRPVLEERLLPHLRAAYGSPDVTVTDALVRRYLPDERTGLRAHYDVSAFATAIVPLVAADAYEGGLYVQGAPDDASRRIVRLERGDVLLHQWDVMHGVHVTAGERYSLVLWFSESDAARRAGACPWVRRAAEAGGNGDGAGHSGSSGHPAAQFILGTLHYDGLFGEVRDAAQAARWFAHAAHGGSAHAQLWLATMYANGEGGLPVDFMTARQHWRAAADAGLAAAQFALATAYEHGYGGASDRAEAVRWLRAAAAQGHAPSLARLGELEAVEDGASTDVR